MLQPTSTLYRVYHSCGAGTARGPAFKNLEDAKRFVLEQRTPGSFAIRQPDGRWYRWGESGSVVFEIPSPKRFAKGTRIGADAAVTSNRSPALTSPMGYPPGVPSSKPSK